MPSPVSQGKMQSARDTAALACGAPSVTTTCPHCDAISVGRADPALPNARSTCPSCARSLRISGRFHVGAEIDRGGVARIHAAHGLDEPHCVAAVVKVMDRSPLNSSEVHELFARSARLLDGLSHRGVPRVLGFDSNEVRSFLVMERFAGGTLYERVKRDGALRRDELDRLLRGLLETIAYLHSRALIHGDVTPRNVMFRSAIHAEGPVLVDFDGLCHQSERALASLVMTPGYAAPEQRAGEMTLGADLYGVGATLVFAATGQSPERLLRRGGAMELDLASSRLSPSTRQLVQRLVALDPTGRPKSACEALSLLTANALNEDASMEDATLEDAPIRRRRGIAARGKHRATVRTVLAVVMLLLVCVLAGCAFALARSTARGTPHRSPPSEATSRA